MVRWQLQGAESGHRDTECPTAHTALIKCLKGNFNFQGFGLLKAAGDRAKSFYLFCLLCTLKCSWISACQQCLDFCGFLSAQLQLWLRRFPRAGQAQPGSPGTQGSAQLLSVQGHSPGMRMLSRDLTPALATVCVQHHRVVYRCCYSIL